MAFDQAQEKTAGKMSDLVMEYVSQYVAREYLEAYERVMTEERFDFVPGSFDDKIYKKISKHIRKKTGRNKKTLRSVLYFIISLICISCISFTVAVLMHESLRLEILSLLGIN